MTFALVASGTATLENAYLGIPMIVVYKTSLLSYYIAKKLVKIPDVGLANIVAGRRVVPELIQSEASEENISEVALNWLCDPGVLSKVKEELLQVKEKMGKPGVHNRVSKVLTEFFNA